MSKDISIREGDQARSFNNVRKIRINNQGSGSSYWVPEDETKLGTKYINKNGTYIASQETDDKGASKGLYGYSQVTVSGIGKAIIDAQEGDKIGGVDLDPFNPNEVEEPENDGDPPKVTVMPSKIDFITPPIKRGYHDGEPINITGSVVAGFIKKENNEWEQWAGDADHPNGIIPLDELTLEPDTAHMQGAGGDIYERNGVQALGILCDKGPIGSYVGGYHCENPIGDAGGGNWYFLSRSESGFMYYTRYNGEIYGISGNVSSHGYYSFDSSGDTGYGTGPSWAVSGNVFQYWNTTSEDNFQFNLIKDSIPVSEVNPVGVDFSNPEIIYETVTINVKWKRLIGKKELKTSFKIAVVSEEE